MAQVRDYNKLAHDIIHEVGGAQNIVNATRCATRFRLVLKETPADGRAVFSPGVADVDSASAAADVSADGGGTMATFSCAKSGTEASRSSRPVASSRFIA